MTIKIAQLGLGTVGQGLYETFQQAQYNNIEYVYLGAKDPNKPRTGINHSISYNHDNLSNIEHDILVELTTDYNVAWKTITESLENGIPVISANKKAIAHHLREIDYIQKHNQTPLLYEGAVAGSVPIIRTIKNYYPKNSITSIKAILNGTCNFILSQMTYNNLSYSDALYEAQKAGFAEVNPSTDVLGLDTANKLSILIYHAFGEIVLPNEFPVEGIEQISSKFIQDTYKNGKVVKLIASVDKVYNQYKISVSPKVIDKDDPFASINNEYNIVEVDNIFSGKQQFIGRGAGALPTALAVLSDVNELKRDLVKSIL